MRRFPHAAALQVWIDRIYARGYVAVDTETTALNEMRAELGGHFALRRGGTGLLYSADP